MKALPKINYLIAASFIVAPLILLLVQLIGVRDPLPVEIRFSQWLQASPIPALRELMIFISLFGYSPWALVLVLLISLSVMHVINRWTGTFFLIVGVFQGLINRGLKELIARPRPAESLVRVMLPNDGYAFPSGHVMFYSVCLGLLIYLILRNTKPGAIRTSLIVLLALGIIGFGPSRIYLGAHWLSDVIAGYLIGFLILAWSIFISENRESLLNLK